MTGRCWDTNFCRRKAFYVLCLILLAQTQKLKRKPNWLLIGPYASKISLALGIFWFHNGCQKYLFCAKWTERQVWWRLDWLLSLAFVKSGPLSIQVFDFLLSISILGLHINLSSYSLSFSVIRDHELGKLLNNLYTGWMRLSVKILIHVIYRYKPSCTDGWPFITK